MERAQWRRLAGVERGVWFVAAGGKVVHDGLAHSEESRSLSGVGQREGNEIGNKGAGECGAGLR